MSTEEYRLEYKADNHDILAKSNVVIRLLRLLDQVADRLIAKLPKLFTGVGRAAGSATPKIQGAATALNKVEAAASGATQSVLGAQTAMLQMNTITRQAAGSAQRLSGGLGNIAAARAGLMLTREAMDVVKDALKDARDFAKETAEEVLKIQDAVRELAAVKGEGTKQASEGVVKLMLASGAKVNEAIAFETMWESAIPAAKQNVDPATGKTNWQLTDKETEESKVAAMRFAVANGIDPATMGRMIPSIGIGQPIQNKGDLMGQLAAMHAMAVQGVGTFSPIMKVYNKLRPTMVDPSGNGATKSSGELLGVISAQTVTAGRETQVAQDINQVWRDLSFADNEEKQKTFEKYGIKPGDDYVTRVEKIAPLLEGARAKGMDEKEALWNAGFHRTGSNPKIIAAVRNKAVLRARVDAVEGAADPGKVEAANAKFRAENPDRFADAALEAARLHRGEETKDMEVMRKLAEAEGIRHRHFGKGLMNTVEGFMDMRLPYVGSLSQGLLGQEPAHNKALDVIISQYILKNVPNAQARYPDLSGTLNTHPTFQPARGPRLAEIIRSLTPEERAKVTEEMQRAAGPDVPAAAVPGAAAPGVGAQPAAPGGAQGVPAQRNGLNGAAAPLPGLGGPQASAGGVPGGPLGAGDPLVLTELKTQTRHLANLNAKVVTDRSRGIVRGPLRSDVDESGNLRT